MQSSRASSHNIGEYHWIQPCNSRHCATVVIIHVWLYWWHNCWLWWWSVIFEKHDALVSCKTMYITGVVIELEELVLIEHHQCQVKVKVSGPGHCCMLIVDWHQPQHSNSACTLNVNNITFNLLIWVTHCWWVAIEWKLRQEEVCVISYCDLCSGWYIANRKKHHTSIVERYH